MSNKFVHIHLHSEYSLLDGLTKLKKLTSRVKEMDMDTVAITDHGVMYGAIDFYKQAQKDGVKPIIGMEAYTTLGDHTLRGEGAPRQNNHLLLLAKDEEGYKNMMKITSIAHLEGYYYRPRITRDLLAKYSKGLIVTSACPAGELAAALIDGNMEEAKKTAKWFYDVFGEDYYLEVQRHNYENHIHPGMDPVIEQEQRKMAGYEKLINEGVLQISREMGIPIVATNDAHYLNKEDAQAQDVLVCVATGKLVSDTKRIRFIDTPEYYAKSPEEMAELFPDLPEALENTVKIAEKCNFIHPTLGKWFFPTFPVPENKNPDDYLRETAYAKLTERYPEPTNEIRERLDYELGIIIQKGYAPYFLIVMSMVAWALEQGIITNTRGSAAGSITSYILGITSVDPIKYYLPFERFLNPFRPTPPDIDFDVPDNRREDIINYMRDTYGHEKVAQICTFGRMLARAGARDVARVLGYPYATGDRISKLIPPPKQGFPIDIPKALVESPELKALYDSDQDARKIIDLAHQVEGSARHISIHAAGVVISPVDITEFSPLQHDEPNGEKIITQYEMHAAEDVGLIKFDILGIRNLSILGSAVEIVQKTRDLKVDIRNLPMDDAKTFEMLGRGETMGVFQMGGGGMTKWLIELKPERIEDLMAMVALYRPGPMQTIPEYIDRKRHPEKVSFLDPRMEKFLGASYGLIVYQDDLLFCALDLAGYTWEEADKFRKAVGKKIPEEMAAQKEKFFAGIISNGQTLEFAEMLWKLFEPFQSYGFNKAHAASYGVVAYQTAYMKANFPVEYMCALMTAEAGDTEKITAAISECRRMGVKILPPDINESHVGFTISNDEASLDGRAIRFGLSAIKNVGHAAIEAILEARDVSNFTSLGDFYTRIDSRKVNKRVLESLIKVGALGAFGTRAAVLQTLDDLRSKTKPKSPLALTGQQDLFGEDEVKQVAQNQIYPVISDIPEFPEDQLSSLERELLGFSLSSKPVEEIIGALGLHASHRCFEINQDFYEKGKITLACVPTEVRVVVTKTSNQEMAFVKLEDGTGVVDAVIFPKLFKLSRDMWIDSKPLLLTGKVDFRDDKPNFLVDTVQTQEEVTTTEGTLKIKVPAETPVDNLKDLKKLLEMHPGNQKVVLIFEARNNQAYDLPFGINWTQTLSRSISDVLYGKSEQVAS
jgi:DNA polymerase III subunit alpha